MQKWTRKAAAVIAVICLAFGTAGVVMHKWDEMRQEKGAGRVDCPGCGNVRSRDDGRNNAGEKVPEVENEIGETNAIKGQNMCQQLIFQRWICESGRRCLDSDSGNSDQLSGGSGKDNDYYLHRDLNGQKSTAGTIFLTMPIGADFSSLHNVLYGHHMKNGSMFKDISRYKDQGYFDQHSEIILYTPEREIHLKALAAVCTSPDAIRRKTEFASGEEFASYIQQMTAGASASAPVEGTIVRLYSFVTCSYEFNNARTILYAYEAAE
ncbi:MAG: class B sortase [Clostridium fessum]